MRISYWSSDVCSSDLPVTLDQLAPEIDALFAKYQTEAHIPGMVYGIVKAGRLDYVKGIGVQSLIDKRPVTPDSMFRIASMTKAFTALAILKPHADGNPTRRASCSERGGRDGLLLDVGGPLKKK